VSYHELPKNLSPLREPVVEQIHHDVAGLYFRSVLLIEAGTVIPQHVHDHDHATYVGAGSVRLWVDREWKGDFVAGTPVEIPGGKQHLFMSLEANTRLCCVHHTDSAESASRKED
jgi:quercetin dioxygenase-like cupin family protein